ncbi:hypothetical protein [Thermaerobacter composti]|uniref:HK97 gp10 family phage protein n=1 Tax=Thermaerobacter composti TaxID=554949 RepID=A0ABZ0QUH3_9FIRM|nr:hypothetical protein [Thermaerobacter composti]WPD20180.1 hypothetical protein Q5761_06000 [Thermaerobacter composti]
MPEGLGRVLRNLDAWHLRQRAATIALAQNWAGRMEAHMKREAPWEDRTGNARNGLFAGASFDGHTVRIRLGHTVHYGVYLELANEGRYAIIGPTRRKFEADLKRSFEELWRG